MIVQTQIQPMPARPPPRGHVRAKPPVPMLTGYQIRATAPRATRQIGVGRSPLTTGGIPVYGGALSSCAREYLLAMTNPFRLTNYPCVPDSIAIPSWKFTTSASITMTVGTNRVGWVVVAGHSMASTDGLRGDLNRTPLGTPTPPIAYTDQNYGVATAGPFPVLDPSFAGPIAGVVMASPGNAPYNYASWLSGEKSVRLVGVGMQITPTGPVGTRAGALSLVRFDPVTYPQDGSGQAPPTGSWTPDDFLNRNDTITTSVGGGPYVIAYTPRTPNDVNYYAVRSTPSAIITRQNAQVAVPQASIGAYILGATPGDTYLVRVLAYFEAMADGRPTTASHSDVVGFGRAIAMANGPGRDEYGNLRRGN